MDVRVLYDGEIFDGDPAKGLGREHTFGPVRLIEILEPVVVTTTHYGTIIIAPDEAE